MATRRDGMPLAARGGLLRAAPVLLARGRVRTDVPVRLPGGDVLLGAESLHVDAMTLQYLWGDKLFAVDCRDRVVLDLGAHKGYFGARALADGAAHVYSFEPESRNFRRLEQARQSHSCSQRWTAQRAAVGDMHRTVRLFVSAESWAHSVQEGMVDAVSVEEVPMVTLTEVLEEVDREHPDSEIVLKVNVEGSVGSILLPTPPEQLKRVVEVQMDHEPGSPYNLTAVLAHLAAVGLDQVERPREKLYRIRRGSD